MPDLTPDLRISVFVLRKSTPGAWFRGMARFKNHRLHGEDTGGFMEKINLDSLPWEALASWKAG